MAATMDRVTVRTEGRRSTHAYYESHGVWSHVTVDLRQQTFRLNERGQERITALLRLYVHRASAYAADAPEQAWRCSWTVNESTIEAEGLLGRDARDCLMRLLAVVEDPKSA